MCGVIGLICEQHRPDLGLVASELLRTLEYRGYDSTGAAIQTGGSVKLLKGVGAPSALVQRLGIVGEAGEVFCGQVRWATFGAVDELNAQPHLVRCRGELYGAHNGNVTNCEALKAWLLAEGHSVLSDNDGEMVVHTIEHFFHAELARGGPPAPEARRLAMRAAILRAAARLEGSYAAVVVDPQTRLVWAIKQGSSLYFGLGRDAGGRFGIASSDLSAVLKLTRLLVPLSEGECVEYDSSSYQLFCVRDRTATTSRGQHFFSAGELVTREPSRSRLRATDTALDPRFRTFMDQEIASQEATCRNVVTLFGGGSKAQALLGPLLAERPEEELGQISERLEELRDQKSDHELGRQFHRLVDSAPFQVLLAQVSPELKERGTRGSRQSLAEKLTSSEAGLLADLLEMARHPEDLLAVRLLDVLMEREETREFGASVQAFLDRCLSSLAAGGRLYVVCCGSSYHAAKAASLFFNELAGVQLHAVLPGEFRGEYSRSLRDGDLFIAVSQSGETKDLIDVLNDLIASGLRIARIALVNNLNSTLAQEKAEIVIPLRCGPEIAVPATKSFLNQLALFYCLALELGARRGVRPEDLARRREELPSLPALIRKTIDSTEASVEQAAELLYLCPSIHLLATRLTAVAMEGALKIREVVLNHAEGFEGSEFKHGPNTILGFNTVLGPAQLQSLLQSLGALMGEAAAEAAGSGLAPGAVGNAVRAVGEKLFAPSGAGPELDRAGLFRALYQDYPLLYITGPDERDVALTVSQINTHKIRGAMTLLVAEEHPALREAAAKVPAGSSSYRWVYLTLPSTGDNLMVPFTATVVLQRLALKMSLKKAEYLHRLGIQDHGVHPDVPKNASKSITVD